MMTPAVTCASGASAACHEASEGDGAAGEKPERTVGETGEVQRAGNYSNVFLFLSSSSDPTLGTGAALCQITTAVCNHSCL